jgi:hypothetical protein
LQFRFRDSLESRSTTLMAGILIFKAREARTKNYRKTEMWLYLPKEVRPPEAYAQWASSTVLRETYLTFAKWTSMMAIAMWVLALGFSLVGKWPRVECHCSQDADSAVLLPTPTSHSAVRRISARARHEDADQCRVSNWRAFSNRRPEFSGPDQKCAISAMQRSRLSISACRAIRSTGRVARTA